MSDTVPIEKSVYAQIGEALDYDMSEAQLACGIPLAFVYEYALAQMPDGEEVPE